MQNRNGRWTVDPNRDAATHHDVTLCIDVPTFGKPSDDLKAAQGIKAILQTGLHSRVRVEYVDKEGDIVEVADRDWKVIV